MDKKEIEQMLYEKERGMTHNDVRQLLIMSQSCQRDAVMIVRTKYLHAKSKDLILNNEKLIAEVQGVRDELLKDIILNYWK